MTDNVVHVQVVHIENCNALLLDDFLGYCVGFLRPGSDRLKAKWHSGLTGLGWKSWASMSYLSATRPSVRSTKPWFEVSYAYGWSTELTVHPNGAGISTQRLHMAASRPTQSASTIKRLSAKVIWQKAASPFRHPSRRPLPVGHMDLI